MIGSPGVDVFINRIRCIVAVQSGIATGLSQINIDIIVGTGLDGLKLFRHAVVLHLLQPVFLVIRTARRANQLNKRLRQKLFNLRQLPLIMRNQRLLHKNHPVKLQRVLIIPVGAFVITGFDQRHIQPGILTHGLAAVRQEFKKVLQIAALGITDRQHQRGTAARLFAVCLTEHFQQRHSRFLPLLLPV